MKKLKSNQSGFGTVELVLIVIVVGLVGVVGWLVYKNKHPAPVKPVVITKTVQTKPAKTGVKSVQNTVSVPEFGIQLVNVPEGIKDMTYTISTGANYKAAYFTTPSLAKLDSSCSIGGLNSYPGTYNSATDQYPLTTFVKQFDTFWVASLHIGVPCGEAGTASFNLQSEQIQAFGQLVKTDSSIQAIKQ